MSVNQISGKHLVFYYYGFDHLQLNLCKYIHEGIHNNEVIYVSIDLDLQCKLGEILKHVNIGMNHIVFFPVRELVLIHKTYGAEQLKCKIEASVSDALSRGYNGIRWICQASLAIQETSKKDFLNVEKDLTEIMKGTKGSLLCIYDFEDYLCSGKVIDDTVIADSRNTHTHIFSGLNVYPIDEVLI